MEFPVTIESQEAFDEVIKDRLSREKTKHADMQQQIDALTAEKQGVDQQITDLTSKAESAEARAGEAEKWRADRETADKATELRASVAKEFGIDAKTLRGADEAELREHAQIIKDVMPAVPVVPNIGDSPSGEASVATQFVADFFGGGK